MGKGNLPKAFVIVNPTAGGGRAGKIWPQVCSKLLRSLGPFDFASTDNSEHTRQLAVDAAREKYPLVISYGGDGTIHEVVNGLLKETNSPPPTLGILASGTGCDLTRTLGIPKNISSQIAILCGKKSEKIDIGQAEYQNSEGKKERRLFVNVTDAGMGASVMLKSRSWKILSRKLAYLVGTLEAFAHWENRPIKLVLDGREEQEGKYMVVAIANGRYFGAGMPIAPKASLSDGYFEVVTLGPLNPLELALALPLLYSGQLARLPHVTYRRARHIEMTSAEGVLLEIDGEPIGKLPATFELLPRRLQVKVP